MRKWSGYSKVCNFMTATYLGYARNKRGKCVLPEECGGKKDNGCASVDCESGYVCNKGKCIPESADGSCAAVSCVANTTCIKGVCVMTGNSGLYLLHQRWSTLCSMTMRHF